ncbi:MAG: glutamate 5-kinase, partial [Azoarcus sp.]|nr:glutamate 5-kinase [Azoarcus sp.]
DPTATLIGEAAAEDASLEAMAGGAGTGIGKGGMITKVRAAQRAARSGAHTCIASGAEPDALVRLAAAEPLGTLLYATSTPLAARKQWMADHLQLAGSLVVDEGAAKALATGRSLLPVGVVEVRGEFERGAVVACRTSAGEEVARGLVNYSSTESRRIARQPSSRIEALLGYIDEPELIHRDNMIMR